MPINTTNFCCIPEPFSSVNPIFFQQLIPERLTGLCNIISGHLHYLWMLLLLLLLFL